MNKIQIASMASVINKPPLEKNQATNPLEQIESDIRELMIKYYSLSHEFDNYKNKAETDTKQIFLKFLSVADEIEDILKSTDLSADSVDRQTKNLISNFQLILKKWLRELNECGVIPIPIKIGEKVDPNWHNVAEVVEGFEKEDGIIVEEIRKGYTWDSKLLRAADVKIIKNKEN